MENFLIGVFSAIFLYLMTYSYLPSDAKIWYTDTLVGPILDTIFFIFSMMIAGATSASLFLALGLSVGFSLIMRALAWINVHFREY